MESKNAGKQHFVLMSRIDITKIQEDARAELLQQIEALGQQIRWHQFDIMDMRNRIMEDHR